MARIQNSRPRVNGWLLDYAYDITLDDFSKYKSVDRNSNRELIQWALSQPQGPRTERKIKYFVLLLLCRLADGENYNIRYSDSSNTTVLEDALGCFTDLQSLLPDDIQKQCQKLHNQIKEQAVLVCCRQEDFTTANEVYERLWCDVQPNEKDCYAKLKRILKEENQREAKTNENSYHTFLERILLLLKKINDLLAPCLLLKLAAEQEDSESGELSNSTDLDKLHRSKRKRKKSYSDNKMSPQKKSNIQSPNKGKRDKAYQLQMIPSSLANYANKKFSLNEIKNAAMEMEIGNTVPFLTPKKEKALLKNLVDNPNVNDNAGAQSSSEEEIEERGRPHQSLGNNRSAEGKDDEDNNRSLATRLGARDVIKKDIPRLSRKPNKWSMSETEQFYKAVQKCGVGKWTECKQHMATDRLSTQLKDRWRNMLKSGIVDRLKDKFGDLDE